MESPQAHAQGNRQGNIPAQNVASKATQGGGGNDTIKTEKEYETEILDTKMVNPDSLDIIKTFFPMLVIVLIK